MRVHGREEGHNSLHDHPSDGDCLHPPNLADGVWSSDLHYGSHLNEDIVRFRFALAWIVCASICGAAAREDPSAGMSSGEPSATNPSGGLPLSVAVKRSGLRQPNQEPCADHRGREPSRSVIAPDKNAFFSISGARLFAARTRGDLHAP